jgi:putrescine transport system substrate-binding protein
MKRIAILSMVFLAGVAATSFALAEDKRLNIFSWAGIFDDETLQGYQKNTGVTPQYDAFVSDEALETALLTGGSGYDIVTPSASPFLAHEIRAGVLQKLAPNQIPNLKKLDPALMELLKSSDPKNEFAIIAAWGTTGLGLNMTKVRERLPGVSLDSYDVLFKPQNAAKLADCGIAILDSPVDIVPIVLKYLKLDPNSEDPADLRKAIDVLNGLRPSLRYIDSSKYMNDLASGEICAVIGWSGDILTAAQGAREVDSTADIEYVIPKEGTLVWMTAMAVPADAPHPEAAFAFINHTLDPKVAAHLAEITGFPSAVPESRQYIRPEMASSTVLFPSPEVMKTLFLGGTSSDEYVRARTRAWTTFRNGI